MHPLKSLVSRTMVDFAQMAEFARDPLILTRGDGVRVWDVDGRSYIDGVSGVFVVGVGHGNRRVIDAMRDQLERLTFAAPTLAVSDRMLELVEELLKLTPEDMSVVKFQTGGSEAIEASIKMARQFHRQRGKPAKYKVISHYGSYHGATVGALSATGQAHFRNIYEPLATGFIHLPGPDPRHCPLNGACPPCQLSCADLLEATLRLEGPDTVAAVIIEPIMNMAGVVVPPREYLVRVREICEMYEVWLIFDEVVTGFGRLGKWFAAEHFGVWPDLMCVGKGLTSGYAPLSAVLIRGHLAKGFWGEPIQSVHFRSGHTYGGNPLSCAAAVAVIREIQERKLLERAGAMGTILRSGLEGLSERHDCARGVRGLGLLLALDVDAPADEAPNIGRKLRENGLLTLGVSPPGMIRLAPPLTIEKSEIEEILGIVDKVLAEFDGGNAS